MHFFLDQVISMTKERLVNSDYCPLTGEEGGREFSDLCLLTESF